MKTYELTDNTRRKWNRTLTQIRAVVNVPGCAAIGDLGGWIEAEASIGEDVWIGPDAEVFAAAVIRAGEIWGGEIWGGEIRAGEDYISICPIGSECGVLSANVVDGVIMLSRGCFYGPLAKFERAVLDKHGNNRHTQEYAAVVALIRLRFDGKGREE